MQSDRISQYVIDANQKAETIKEYLDCFKRKNNIYNRLLVIFLFL